MIINQIQDPGQLRVYTAGLLRREWDGATYRADPAAVAANEGTPSTTGTNTTISSIATNTTEAIIWRGYFLPDVTSSSWQFRTNSDDASFVWIGSDSTAIDTNLNTSNAVVNNGGLHGAQTRTSSNISLTDGVFYPFAVVIGNNNGPGTLTLSFSSNGGTNYSTNGLGYFFYNPYAPNGFNLE